MKRDPSRPKCADLPDIVLLEALRDRVAHDVTQPWPPRLAMRKLEKLERRGLIECGVSLLSGFLTDAGKAVLAARGLPTEEPRTIRAADIVALMRALPPRVQTCSRPLHPSITAEEALAAGLELVPDVTLASSAGGKFTFKFTGRPSVRLRR